MILGGAMLPHAPQFFTLPDTEDKANVAQVQAVAARIGEELKALRPPMERCYAFGRALAQVLDRIGVRAVLVASGGMSHFPGTKQYSSPNLAWDQRALEPLRAGNLRSLLAYDEKELDDTGNIELRCWAVAAGALGERKPDIVQLNPSWHHNYASLAWWSQSSPEPDAPHYPSIAPDLVKLTDALHALANDPQARARYVADRAAF